MNPSTKKRYIVLVCGMLIQFCAGIIYMWSVFKGPVAEYLAWDAGAAALTSSVMLAAFVLGILVGGRAQDRFGPRKVIFVGTVVMAGGMMLTALASAATPWLVYITYGVLGGLGVGGVYTATVAPIQKWFPDKRGFATGMTVSAFGFSLVVFAPLAKTMLAGLGVPATFLIFGGAFLVVCGLCALPMTNPPQGYAPAGYVAKQAVATGKQYTTREMLKTKQFYLITFSLLLILPAYFILNPLLMTLGVERGLTEELALVGVMVTGIASAAGRLVVSWVSDKMGRKMALYGINLLTLAAILGMIFAQGILFLVCIAVIAFSFGGASGVYAAVTADSFGTQHMGSNYGCAMLGFGVSALVFPLISNSLSGGGDYTLSFVVAAVTCVIALVLVALMKRPEKG